MSLEGVDDNTSSEILASKSNFNGEEAGSLDTATVKKTLLKADEVLHALNKQSRKQVLYCFPGTNLSQESSTSNVCVLEAKFSVTRLKVRVYLDFQ